VITAGTNNRPSGSVASDLIAAVAEAEAENIVRIAIDINRIASDPKATSALFALNLAAVLSRLDPVTCTGVFYIILFVVWYFATAIE